MVHSLKGQGKKESMKLAGGPFRPSLTVKYCMWADRSSHSRDVIGQARKATGGHEGRLKVVYGRGSSGRRAYSVRATCIHNGNRSIINALESVERLLKIGLTPVCRVLCQSSLFPSQRASLTEGEMSPL